MKPMTWVAAAVVVAAGAGAAAVLSVGEQATAQAAPANTAVVERGPLASAVSATGTLTYKAQREVINRARGTYTALPAAGDRIACGGQLYRVDDEPVLLLCGKLPAYRALRTGDQGADVRQLNRALRVSGDAFTAKTKAALEALQRRRSARADGSLALGEAVFLPRAVRIAKVAARLGGPAQPGARALQATSTTLHVRLDLDPSERRQVARGDRARVALPGTKTLTGRATGASVRLDHPGKARGFDRASVQVEIATKGVEDALSVPVTALFGKPGGGFAVEVVRARRELVPVGVGLFDSTAGRVQVEGELRAGDRVVVPSS